MAGAGVRPRLQLTVPAALSLLLLLPASAAAAAAGAPPPQTPPPPAAGRCDLSALEVGDVVLREGVGADSLLIARLAGGPYTHVGVVVSSTPELIMHAATDDDPSRPNQVILSTPGAYCARGRRIAVKRYALTPAHQMLLAEQARAYVGRPFVLAAGSDALYCTTLAAQLLGAHVPLSLREVEVRVPLVGGRYLSPQSFFEDEGSVLLCGE